MSAGTDSSDVASCNAGERAVGGGFSRTDGAASGGDTISESAPFVDDLPATAGQTPNGWGVGFHTAATESVAIYVVCVSP